MIKSMVGNQDLMDEVQSLSKAQVMFQDELFKMMFWHWMLR
jgi:hypothetical protein